MPELFRPYVPRPVIDWTRDQASEGGSPHRQVDGTLVLADISGFTTLTERLARHGKAGAEEMGEVLNRTFEALLVPAYDRGAALIKWGGDAVLLLFEGEDHAARGARAAWEMQRVMRATGRVRTSAGAVTLSMSVGVHSGALDLFLVGRHHRELVVTGPAATSVTLMEQAASSGQVVVSPQAAAVLAPDHCGQAVGGGLLLTRRPAAPALPPVPSAEPLPERIEEALPETIRAHVASGVCDSEHRLVTTGFVQLQGVDACLARSGAEQTAAALAHVVDLAAEAAARHDVTFLATDVAADGGKIILLAGAPRSHDRAEDRMLCVLREVMDADSPLRLRAGAASGRVFTGDFGPPYRRTYSVVGDSVNLAARLMAAAGPGELLATSEVVERAHTRFVTTDLPPLRVKGKAEPVRAVVVGEPTAHDLPGVLERTALIGRDTELALLTNGLRAARAGRGCSWEVLGGPGLGKTRLLEELRRQAVQDAGPGTSPAVLVVTCDGFDASAPYAAWRRLLRQALGAAADSPAALTALVQERCPDVEPWLPLLGGVLQLELPMTPQVASLDDRFRRTWLAKAVTELLGGLLADGTLLAVDDAQLMDDASTELWGALQAVAPEQPWLVVATRRPSPVEAPAGDEANGSIVLAPLDDAAAAALLESATEQEPLPDHELAMMRLHAQGNPLYLLELLAARRRLGDLSSLPDSLEGIVACAVDQLEPLPRKALRTAAVLGWRFDAALLDEVLTASSVPCTVEVWQAIEPFFAGDEGGYAFRSSLLREAAYEGLPFRQRLHLHGVAGEVLERRGSDHAALLSFHYAHAQRYDDAARWSRLAGDQAASQYANVEAALLHERALLAAGRAGWPASERSAIARSLGMARSRLGELVKAEAALVEARRLAGADPVARGRINLLLATVRTRAGRLPQALRLISRGLAELPSADPEAQEVAASLCAWYAYVRHEQGRQQEAIRWATAAIERARPVGALFPLAQAYQHLDRASVALGRFEHEPEAREALRLFTELGERTWQAGALNHLGIRSYYHGSWPDALAYYAQAREVLEQIGDTWNAAIAALNIAEVYTDQGRLADAELLVRQAIRVFRAAGTPSTIAVSEALLGRIASADGRFDEAAELFARARTAFAGDGEQGSLAEAEARALESLICQGSAPDALQRADAMIAQVRRDGQVSLLPLLHRVRGWALAQTGDAPGAYQALTASLQQARDLNARADIALALDGLARLAEHQASDPAVDLTSERDGLFELLGIHAVPVVPIAPQPGPADRALGEQPHGWGLRGGHTEPLAAASRSKCQGSLS